MNKRSLLIYYILFISVLSRAQSNFLSQDSLWAQSSDCQVGSICVHGFPPSQLPDFSISDNGFPYTGATGSCDFDTIYNFNFGLFFSLNAGPYTLNSWTANGQNTSGTFQNLSELVALMNGLNPGGLWHLDNNSTTIIGGQSGFTYSNIEISSLATSQSYSAPYNLLYNPNSTSFSLITGVHHLIFTDLNNGMSDTLVALLYCITPENIVQDIFTTDAGSYCVDLSQLPGSNYTVTNVCPQNSGNSITLSIDDNSGCINFSAIGPGTDSACIVVCDEHHLCDTTYLIYNVFNIPTPGVFLEHVDEVMVGNSEQFCLDVSNLGSSNLTIENICAPASDVNASFSIDTATYCINYTGLQAGGVDSACYLVCNPFGGCDTFVLIITVTEGMVIMSETYFDTVFINTTQSYCPDTTQLPGNIVSITNACPFSSGDQVAFQLDDQNYCVSYSGLDIGNDMACIVLTDDLGNSDTTYYVITSGFPEPINDTTTIYLNQSGTFCLDSTLLPGIESGMINICPGGVNDNATFVIQPGSLCADISAISMGIDSACLYITDNAGNAALIHLFIVVSAPVSETITYTLLVGQNGQYCVDTTQLSGITSIINNCAGAAGDNVMVNFGPGNYCVDYQAVFIGSDTICFLASDQFGFSDTTTLIFNVVPPQSDTIQMTLTVGQDSIYCLDLSQLAGDLQGITNDCLDPLANIISVNIVPQNPCMDIAALSPGVDTACIIYSDAYGAFDTTVIIVNVLVPPTHTDTIFQTISVNESLTYCVDTNELTGNVTSIVNVCENLSGSSVIFDINDINLCVFFEGIFPGTEQACIVVCDDAGVCDTTILIVTVQPSLINPPVAVNDADTTSLDTPIFLDLLANDTITSGLTVFTVISGPNHGMVDTLGLGIVRYIPDAAYCGWDTFEYVICSQSFCDTAQVHIFVECPSELFFYTGISPNGDDRNDVWRINGLQLIPNHELTIFDRWGLEVMHTEHYNNDWDGTWKGKRLPDGTYFYLFRDKDKQKNYSGYIQIIR